MKIEIGKRYKYSFDNKQGHTEATVEIIRLLKDGSACEVKFIAVKEDNTGNGIFNYLLKIGETMNVSACYLTETEIADKKENE